MIPCSAEGPSCLCHVPVRGTSLCSSLWSWQEGGIKNIFKKTNVLWESETRLPIVFQSVQLMDPLLSHLLLSSTFLSFSPLRRSFLIRLKFSRARMRLDANFFHFNGWRWRRWRQRRPCSSETTASQATSQSVIKPHVSWQTAGRPINLRRYLSPAKAESAAGSQPPPNYIFNYLIVLIALMLNLLLFCVK